MFASRGASTLPADPLELVLRAGRFHEDDVRPGRRIGPGPVEGLVQSQDTPGIGARDDDEVRVAACVQRRRQLAEHLGGGDHALFVEMPAALRHLLVFDVATGHPGPLVGPDCAHDVDGIAVTRIGIGDKRNIDRVGDTVGVVHHLGKTHQAEIRDPQACVGNPAPVM